MGYLQRHLQIGNQVLVVTKSGPEVVGPLCEVLTAYDREQSEIRYTLSHLYASIGNFWEPGAPSCQERILALETAHKAGVRTSVSCEPWLEATDTLQALVSIVDPMVTETIWIGWANKLRQRTAWCKSRELSNAITLVEAFQTPETTRALYEALNGNPKIRWKDSIRQMLGLDGEGGVE